MNKVLVGLKILEFGLGLIPDRSQKRQALRDKYDRIVQENENNDN